MSRPRGRAGGVPRGPPRGQHPTGHSGWRPGTPSYNRGFPARSAAPQHTYQRPVSGEPGNARSSSQGRSGPQRGRGHHSQLPGQREQPVKDPNVFAGQNYTGPHTARGRGTYARARACYPGAPPRPYDDRNRQHSQRGRASGGSYHHCQGRSGPHTGRGGSQNKSQGDQLRRNAYYSSSRSSRSFPRSSHNNRATEGRTAFKRDRSARTTQSHNPMKHPLSKLSGYLAHMSMPQDRTVSQPSISNLHILSEDPGKYRRQNHLDLDALKDLLQMDSTKVVMKLAAPGSGWKELLQNENNDNMVSLILKVLNKACDSQSNLQNLLCVLGAVKDFSFLKKALPMFVMNMDSQDKQQQRVSTLQQVVTLLLTILEAFPNSSIDDVSFIIALLEREFNSIQLPGFSEVQHHFQGLQRAVQHLKEKKLQGTLKSDQDSFRRGDLLKTEMESRSNSIFPISEEVLMPEQKVVKPESARGQFEDTSSFLDLQFKLLKESFVKPLRDRISNLLKSERKGLDHVYYKTTIVGPVYTYEGIHHTVQFDAKNLEGLNTESSKELLNGSLVCLSKDSFKTMLFATVTRWNTNDLINGITTVRFTEESRQKLIDVVESENFVMVDTTAAFKEYHPLLVGLQEFKGDLPLKKYLVNVDTNISPPKYVGSIVHPYQLGNKQVGNILNLSDWPRKEELELDESQLKALQMALTRELAIIEGQPGTGKTYVGLKIIKTLLDNEHIGPYPILVVCHSNQALDIFLEGVAKFLGGVGLVRVGAQHSSKRVQQFSLHELKRNPSFKQSLPMYLNAMNRKLHFEGRLVREELKKIAEFLENASKGILHEKVLEGYLVSLHGAGLAKAEVCDLEPSQKTGSLIMEWLGLSLLSDASAWTDETCGEYPTEIFSDEEEEHKNIYQTSEEDDTEDVWRDVYKLVRDTKELAEDHSSSCDPDERDTERFDRYTATPSCIESLSEYHYASGDDLYLSGSADGDSGEEHDQESSGTDAAKKSSPLQPEEGGDMGQQLGSRGEPGLAVADDQRSQAERGMGGTHDVGLVYVLPHEEEDVEEERFTEAWQMSNDMKRELQKVVRQELAEAGHMLELDAKQITDLWALPLKDRWHLYRLWLSMFLKDMRADVVELEREYQSIIRRTEELKLHEDEIIFKQAKVIGMTSLRAAQYWRVLKEIQPKVVLVEEAEEVLEALLVTTLTPACQQLILIGDSRQQHDSTTLHEQAKAFNMQVSLFQRLLLRGFPSVRLNFQHRMCPEILQVLKPHICDQQDIHHSHLHSGSVKGVTANVFFVDHKHMEEDAEQEKSHRNHHEAAFVKALCHYLISQGYRGFQITVLTPCLGQLYLLKELMPKSEFRGVNVTLVSRYHGGENDIVIVSLVRSNLEGQVGLMMERKIVSLAMSRARKGLFCIGNMTTHSAAPVWAWLSTMLRLGEALVLQCENHPHTLTSVSTAEDFLQVSHGGCSRLCGQPLTCGHACANPCHPGTVSPQHHKCDQQCAVFVETDGKRLGRFGCRREPVTAMPMPGGWRSPVLLFPQDPNKFRVNACNKLLPCGHLCMRGPEESCTKKCPKLVKVDLPCGHQRPVPCHVYQSSRKRQIPLECVSQCEERLICSHRCQERCGTECGPCRKPCPNLCYHDKCNRLCYQECKPCVNKCGWHCRHHRCTRVCRETCDRPPCQFPCHKLLNCKHPCIGVCGEPCPSVCRLCNRDEVQELFFGNEAHAHARFVLLHDCGHIFEVSEFDKWMAQPEADAIVRQKACPRCSTPIRRSARYSSIVKQGLRDLEAVKHKATTMMLAEIQKAVEANERKGITSPFIRHLQCQLADPSLDTCDVKLINDKVGLLFQLAEIQMKLSRHIHPMGRQELIGQIGQCSERILQVGGGQICDSEKEVKRIVYLAEAQALSDRRLQSPSSSVSPAAHRGYDKLNEVISKLSAMSLQEDDIDKLGSSLYNIADTVRQPLYTKFVEGSKRNYVRGFLKQGSWSKCQRGHMYFNEYETRSCDECCK